MGLDTPKKFGKIREANQHLERKAYKISDQTLKYSSMRNISKGRHWQGYFWRCTGQAWPLRLWKFLEDSLHIKML